MSDRVAAVTGGTGAVGPRLISGLVENGWLVRVLVRPDRSLPFDSRVEVVRGDLDDAAALRALVDGAEVAFHLAGLLHLRAPDRSTRRLYERVNVEGTRRVAEAAAQAGASRLIYFSTIAVYGLSRPGEEFDEASPTMPPSPYAETKLRGEQAALAFRRADGARLTTVLRLAAVYGPHMKGSYRQLAQALARGRFVPIGAGLNRRTLVCEADVAAAALLAAEAPEAAGRIFNVTDGCVHRLHEILDAIAAAVGRPLPPWRLPAAPFRSAGRVAALFGRPGRVLSEMVDRYFEDVAVRGDKIQAMLGFRPACDLRAGWAEAVRGMAL